MECVDQAQTQTKAKQAENGLSLIKPEALDGQAGQVVTEGQPVVRVFGHFITISHSPVGLDLVRFQFPFQLSRPGFCYVYCFKIIYARNRKNTTTKTTKTGHKL